MRSRSWIAAVGACVTAAGLTAAAQQKPDTDESLHEVTLVGCLELEKDYRARIDAGRGGVLGTGIGVGNEFVLTNARPASDPGADAAVGSAGSSATAAAGTTGAEPARATAPVGSAGANRPDATDKPGGTSPSGLTGDYSLTGKLEGDMIRQIGRLVEVIGTVEAIEAHDSAQDAKELPELTVRTWHTRQDVCPPGTVTGSAGTPPASAAPASAAGKPATTPQPDSPKE